MSITLTDYNVAARALAEQARLATCRAEHHAGTCRRQLKVALEYERRADRSWDSVEWEEAQKFARDALKHHEKWAALMAEAASLRAVACELSIHRVKLGAGWVVPPPPAVPWTDALKPGQGWSYDPRTRAGVSSPPPTWQAIPIRQVETAPPLDWPPPPKGSVADKFLRPAAETRRMHESHLRGLAILNEPNELLDHIARPGRE